MLEKKSSKLDIAIQKAVAQARDTNFFQTGITGRGVYPFINLFEKEETWCCPRNYPDSKKKS